MPLGLADLLGLGLIGAASLGAVVAASLGSLVLIISRINSILLLVWLLALVLISLLLQDFVVPMVALHRIPVWQASRIGLRRLALPHPASLASYVLARILVNAGVGIVAVLAIPLCCCLALLPYLEVVILLPSTLFQLCYPLAFLAQLGADWQLLPADQS